MKASEETIASSLEGTWLPEQLAVLRRQLGDWDHIQQQIAACDLDLQQRMQALPAADQPTPPALPAGSEGETERGRKKHRGRSSNEPRFDLASELQRVAGVDLTRIDGIKVSTIQTIITEAETRHEPVENGKPLRFLDWVVPAK